MPKRFEIYIVYKRRYINTLPFPFLLEQVRLELALECRQRQFWRSKSRWYWGVGLDTCTRAPKLTQTRWRMAFAARRYVFSLCLKQFEGDLWQIVNGQGYWQTRAAPWKQASVGQPTPVLWVAGLRRTEGANRTMPPTCKKSPFSNALLNSLIYCKPYQTRYVLLHCSARFQQTVRRTVPVRQLGFL